MSGVAITALTDKEMRSLVRWGRTTKTLSTFVIGGDYYADEPALQERLERLLRGLDCEAKGARCDA